ncbi:MAG: metal ABC transporter substrate-binding protein [Proteobacteria bacterium]|nr:metal ABC transporter substrate-binding protein [Pseudomonadota bacterium]
MYRTLALSLWVGLFAAFAAPQSARAELSVVATVPDLAALVKEVGGSKVSVTALSLATQDPHWVDAKPSLVLKVNQADLLVAVGVQLEVGWLPVLQSGARNSRIQRSGAGFLECAAHVELLEVPRVPVNRSMGDVHPGGNPHFLYDPRQARACASAIASKMAALDPDNATAYHKNLAEFGRRLDRARQQWEKRMDRHRGTSVVTYHRSWVYLTKWLGLVEVATLEPKPGIPPSPGHLAKVIRLARSKQVKLLFQEAYYPSRTGNLVADKIGARLVSLPGGTDFRKGQSYLDHMEQVISRLDKALGR